MKQMTKKRSVWLWIGAALLGVTAIAAGLLLWQQSAVFGFARPVEESEQQLRLSLVEEAESWLGTQAGDADHLKILDIYNSHEPLAQGYIVTPEDAWCATFVSAMAIELGLTEHIPTECGCQRQIGLWQAMGRWEEDDGYEPLPGDIIYYSSQGPLTGDCTAWSDHVGIVAGTWHGWIKVIEGNYGDKVACRYIPIDHKDIRGYALPDYAAAAQ